jgi:hypothetical protein
MSNRLLKVVGLIAGVVPSLACAARAQDLPKTQLPFAGVIADTREKSTPAFPAPVTAPKGAPNVVLILFDDVGFSASSTFGGAAATPELDRLATTGLRYNQFHTTAEEVASGHISNFGGFRSAGTETFDIGRDAGSPVSTAYESPNAFQGKIQKVEIDLKP